MLAKNRVLAGERVSRAAIDAAPTDDVAITTAIAACDYDRAACIAFARAKSGAAVDIDTVLRVLPGIELWTIACALIAIAPAGRTRLLELLEQRRFPVGSDSGEVEAIALYAPRRAGADRARLIPLVRRLSVRQMTAEGYALVAVVGAAMKDDNVTAAVKHLAQLAKERADGVAETDRTLARSLDQAIASLPAEVEIPDGGGFTVRTAKTAGRNDPCPCGSGLKFKKCCADKPVKSGSPIAGVSWEEFLTTAADQMTAEHVGELALVDLVRVDLARLPRATRQAALFKLLDARAWTHAERVIASATDAADGEEHRGLLIHDALKSGEPALARRHYDLLADKGPWTIQFTDDPAALWQAVTAAADKAMRSDDRVDAVDLAYALLFKAPTLGIVAARACIGAAKFDDADTLLEQVEDARDDLGLPPGDPAWNVLDAVRADDSDDDESEEAVALRESLRESAARADELERSLATTRAALDDARTPAVAALQRSAEPTRPLEDKVRELEALIRDGNAERRELRRQLTAAKPHEDATAARPKAPRHRWSTRTTRSPIRWRRWRARCRSRASIAAPPMRSPPCRRRWRPRACARSAASPPATSPRGATSSRRRTCR